MTREAFARLAFEAHHDAGHPDGGGWDAWTAMTADGIEHAKWLAVGALIESCVDGAAGRDAASDPEPFAGYALVELMGHAQVTGAWRETVLCGRPMLEITRLDVAERRVQLVGPESVYRLTPLTEAEAMHVTRHSRAAIAAAQDDDEDPWPGDEDDQ